MEKIDQQGLSTKKIPTEYTPPVFNETFSDETKEFRYGATIQQLRPGIEVKETAPTLPSIFSGSVTYTTTGVKTVSGVGFTPRLIKINACLATGSISTGVYFNSTITCNYYFTGAGAADASGNVGYSAYLDNAGNLTTTTTITPTTDGFTINVLGVAGGAVTIIYECYG